MQAANHLRDLLIKANISVLVSETVTEDNPRNQLINIKVGVTSWKDFLLSHILIMKFPSLSMT